MKLTELRTALDQQFKNLIRGMHSSHEKSTKSNQIYRIQDLSVQIFVEMTLIDLNSEVPDDVAFCGGKLCHEEAAIKIEPANEQVFNVVKDYFSEMLPGAGMSGPISRFDVVSINGANI